MTYAEMGTAIDIEINESGGLWFTNAEKSYFLNKAAERFTKTFYEQFEINEHSRANVRTLVKDSLPQSGSTFLLSAITDLNYILRVVGTFTVSGTSVTRQIKPEQIDDLYSEDPFSVGTNSDPKYEEVANTLVIKSTSAPTNVVVTYMKTPNVVDIDGAPGDSLDLPEYTHSEIVDLAKDMLLENMGNPRYPNSKIETNENIN